MKLEEELNRIRNDLAVLSERYKEAARLLDDGGDDAVPLSEKQGALHRMSKRIVQLETACHTVEEIVSPLTTQPQAPSSVPPGWKPRS
ncbi:MAG TPA: hypothetical protein VLJ57_00875 [Burkholderiaceae bacterium]|nr:hypothetical protein [Burkholderiaceae bacterium]